MIIFFVSLAASIFAVYIVRGIDKLFQILLKKIR